MTPLLAASVGCAVVSVALFAIRLLNRLVMPGDDIETLAGRLMLSFLILLTAVMAIVFEIANSLMQS